MRVHEPRFKCHDIRISTILNIYRVIGVEKFEFEFDNELTMTSIVTLYIDIKPGIN